MEDIWARAERYEKERNRERDDCIKLFNLIVKIEEEVEGLRSHGDIPHDSYDDIMSWIGEARKIMNYE